MWWSHASASVTNLLMAATGWPLSFQDAEMVVFTSLVLIFVLLK